MVTGMILSVSKVTVEPAAIRQMLKLVYPSKQWVSPPSIIASQ